MSCFRLALTPTGAKTPAAKNTCNMLAQLIGKSKSFFIFYKTFLFRLPFSGMDTHPQAVVPCAIPGNETAFQSQRSER